MRTTGNILFLLVFQLFLLQASAQNYIFYLHGKIVELQGANAVDTINGYGAYQYNDIVDSLKSRGFIVISEVRKPDTNVKQYASRVAKQVDSLLKKKVKPENITVIGASKGSFIAMYVSSFVKNKKVNYVFMGACYKGLTLENPGLKISGRVLSIYEKTDLSNGASCNTLQEASGGVSMYKELMLNTGLRHGFLYKPLKEWMDPATKWANNNYE